MWKYGVELCLLQRSHPSVSNLAVKKEKQREKTALSMIFTGMTEPLSSHRRKRMKTNIQSWVIVKGPGLPYSQPSRNCATLLILFNLYIFTTFISLIRYSRAWQRFLVLLKKAHAHSTETVFSEPSQLCASQECKHLHFTRGTAIMIQNTRSPCVQIHPINTQ